MNHYILAAKLKGRMTYACGDDPKVVKTASTVEQAKKFESPGDAMEYRARMDPPRQQQFIVHEFDGALLHSLDV